MVIYIYDCVSTYIGICAGMIYFEEMEQGGRSIVNWCLATCVHYSHIYTVACRKCRKSTPEQGTDLGEEGCRKVGKRSKKF